MNFELGPGVIELLVTAAVIAIAGLTLMIMTRRLRTGLEIHLRPIRAFSALEKQIGRATESATRMHVSLGQASVLGAANPTSIAGSFIYDRVAREGSLGKVPPLVTAGEGTLLLLAQQRSQHAYRLAGRTREYEPNMVQFIAHDTDPYAYAAGVSNVIHQKDIAGNVLAGRFGTELAIISDASVRENLLPIVGTDDPTALAIGAAMTDRLLVGEELFAARAYLEGKASQLASVVGQDFLRLIAAIAILGVAIYHIVVGS